MKVKERGHEVIVHCVVCEEEQVLLVNRDDWDVFQMPNRPHIQDIFPYLTAEERELLISGICPKCWKKLFPEPEDYQDR